MSFKIICLLCFSCLVIGLLTGTVVSRFKQKSKNKDELQNYIVKMYSSNGKNIKKQVKQQQKQLKSISKEFKSK